VGSASLFEQAVELHRAGQVGRAEPLYRRVIKQEPQHGDALFLLGVIMLNSERLKEACALLERAVRVAPNNDTFLSNLGVVYARLGRLREATGVLFMAIALKPDLAEAVFTLALVFEEKGELAAAAECYQRALDLVPSLSEAADHLASVTAKQSTLGAAAPPAGGAESDESPVQLFKALATQLRVAGAVDHAAAWYRAALKLDPRSAYLHTALGAIYADTGHLDEAIVHFRRALESDKNFDPARGCLDTALEEAGRYDETEAVFRDAVALRPDDPLPQSVLLFNMMYYPDVSARDILAEARAWNDRHARPLTAKALPHDNDRSPERRLRIGYFSPNFREHAMSRFTIPLLRNHDHRQVEVFCYSSGADQLSAETGHVRACADVWRDVADLDDAALSEVIRRDQIDILVDLNMHLLGRRLLAFARKPAPIQMCWLAYPGTSGLEAMDYRLSDPYLDPTDADTSVYSEETIRLPDTIWCYDPLTDVPEVSPLPALAEGRITFGSLNHFRKVHAGVLRLWAKVLNAVPRSRLILVAPDGARARLHSFFEEAGVTRDRIEFVGRVARLDYLARYREIDIGLDTFPYNGHTTTLDALWMGVPTVTLVGDTVVGRGGVCLSMNMGLPELIAKTEEEYVQVASSLAGDLEHLSALRQTLRARLQQSPLMDAPRFARNLESVYRDVWRRYCAKKPS
jgi:predicted O-linked N-acetylglucosamine transferase (SPINDLY family)